MKKQAGEKGGNRMKRKVKAVKNKFIHLPNSSFI